MRLKALAVRTGVALPPPAGPARAQHCFTEGVRDLTECETARGRGLRMLAVVAPQLLALAPHEFGLDQPMPPAFGEGLDRARARRWFELAEPLDARRRTLREQNLHFLDRVLTEAEGELRRALRLACHALLWFSDVELDVDELAGEEVTQSVRALKELAHRRAHEIGDLVGGAFGCRLRYDSGAWFEECELSLVHVAIGVSAGFTALVRCNVCHADASECPHFAGAPYNVTVSRGGDDHCSVCREACDHEEGVAYEFTAGTYASDIQVREVSHVPRPRDPLARVTALEVDREVMLGALGREPGPLDVVIHTACVGHCQGPHPWTVPAG